MGATFNYESVALNTLLEKIKRYAEHEFKISLVKGHGGLQVYAGVVESAGAGKVAVEAASTRRETSPPLTRESTGGGGVPCYFISPYTYRVYGVDSKAYKPCLLRFIVWWKHGVKAGL